MLLNCESFIHAGIVSFFVCNSCLAPMFSFEWNKEVLAESVFHGKPPQKPGGTVLRQRAEIVDQKLKALHSVGLGELV